MNICSRHQAQDPECPLCNAKPKERPTPETNAKWTFETLTGDVLKACKAHSQRIERERDEARGQRDALLSAMIRLRDCDWVITPADRMDAVREIARNAIAQVGRAE